MTTYTVKYRHKRDLFWKTIKNVKGDILAADLPGKPRVFILNDETRIEVPSIGGLKIVFSKERFLVIKQKMDKDSGQVLPIK